MIGTKRRKLLKLNRKANISPLKDLFDSYVRFETPDNDEYFESFYSNVFITKRDRRILFLMK